jgi:anti-sigma regulatory factor (Ser/Thr protein kinase)
MLKLELLNTAAKGKHFKIKPGLTVGSGEAAHIRAQHESLQPIHARFVERDGRLELEVADPKARLLINGRDVLRHVVRHGDEMAIGPLRLKVFDQAMVSHSELRIDSLLDQVEHATTDAIYDFAREDLFYLVQKEPSLRRNLSFSIPSRDRFIDHAQVFLGRLVRGAEASEEQVDGFMTCVKELVLNAHRHGHKYNDSKVITLRWADLGDRMRLIVEDQGPGFDHRSALAAARCKDPTQAARERYQAGGFGGLGFQLMVRLSDELTYNDAGNVATMVMAKKKLEAEG